MKYGYAMVFIIVLTLLTLMGIYVVVDGTLINEENHNGLKESLNGAMIDAIDIEYYQRTGEMKIIKEKFVENFTRRFFAATRYGKNGYTLEFYDIIESPPKASIRIIGKSGKTIMTLDSSDILQYDIVNRLDSILLYTGTHLYTYDLYAFSNISPVKGIKAASIKMPEELKKTYYLEEGSFDDALNNRKNDNVCQIVKIELIEAVTQANSSAAIAKFNTDKDKWYYNNTGFSTTGNFCEIEAIEEFNFKYETSNPAASVLENLKVRLKNNSCTGITGYKYRVTWECKG